MVSAGVHPDVAEARHLVRRLGLELSDAVPETENAEYGAFVSRVGRGSVRFRVGKLTPAKVGQFVFPKTALIEHGIVSVAGRGYDMAHAVSAPQP
ncbi:hypothetical protein ABIA39_007694 [Nocardia sp. GAS34]|uniref:MepB family protein n=1 Tax=unclassified Nocardia TaxID=2637762 RepID=UPI003D249E48